MNLVIAFLVMLLGVGAIFSDKAWICARSWWQRLQFAYEYPARHRQPVVRKVGPWLGSRMDLCLVTAARWYSNIQDHKSLSSTLPEPMGGTATEDQA